MVVQDNKLAIKNFHFYLNNLNYYKFLNINIKHHLFIEKLVTKLQYFGKIITIILGYQQKTKIKKNLSQLLQNVSY